MSKRSKSQFKEALDAKREALASAAKQPKPEPEWEPETPELRAELAKEQERRRVAERKVQELQNPRRTLGDLIHTNKRSRRAPWK
jgi:predicted  nucleic acid-binding Zn-ribbon protein